MKQTITRLPSDEGTKAEVKQWFTQSNRSVSDPELTTRAESPMYRSAPTVAPTTAPTGAPTTAPTLLPTASPTVATGLLKFTEHQNSLGPLHLAFAVLTQISLILNVDGLAEHLHDIVQKLSHVHGALLKLRQGSATDDVIKEKLDTLLESYSNLTLRPSARTQTT